MKIVIMTAMLVFAAGCAAPEAPKTEAGGQVPLGHTVHCIENPDSVFCKEKDND